MSQAKKKNHNQSINSQAKVVFIKEYVMYINKYKPQNKTTF